MRDNGDGIQGRRWRRAADDCGGGDAGQQGQQQYRYGNMDKAAEETPVKTPTPWTWIRTITSRNQGGGQAEDRIGDRYQLCRVEWGGGMERQGQGGCIRLPAREAGRGGRPRPVAVTPTGTGKILPPPRSSTTSSWPPCPPPSNRDGRNLEFEVGLDGPNDVPLTESFMRKTRQCRGQADGGEDE